MANTEFTPSRTPAGTRNPLDEILVIHHLKRCYFVRLRCAKHGEIRMALAEAATQRRCPLCRSLCDAELLGFGGTTRPLPFWSVRQGVQALEAPGVRND
ncbi:MAG: hypothetical protein ABR866_10940 [Candidatus Korobacteraceae bacterium]